MRKNGINYFRYGTASNMSSAVATEVFKQANPKLATESKGAANSEARKVDGATGATGATGSTGATGTTGATAKP